MNAFVETDRQRLSSTLQELIRVKRDCKNLYKRMRNLEASVNRLKEQLQEHKVERQHLISLFVRDYKSVLHGPTIHKIVKKAGLDTEVDIMLRRKRKSL